MRRYGALLRLALDAFARGPLAALLISGILAGVLFGGNGLDPREVPKMLSTPMARLVAVVVACALFRSGARALLFVPGAAYVRTARVRFERATLALLVLVAVAPLPLAMLRAPFDALHLLSCIAAACVGGPLEIAASLALASVHAFPLGWPLYVFAFVRAHREAPVRDRLAPSFRPRLHWTLHVALTHARAVVRASQTRVLVAFSTPLLALWWVRAGDIDERASRAIGVAPFVAAVTTAVVAPRMGSSIRALRPMVAAAQRWRRAPLVIAIAIVCTPSLAFAAGAHATADVLPMNGWAVVALLLVAEAWLVARRRAVGSTLALIALPVAMTFAWLLRGLLSLVALVVVLSIPEPEVPRAVDR